MTARDSTRRPTVPEPLVPPARRPNILLVVDDQHQRDALGCAGRAGLRTPNLDRLAASGLRSTRAYGQPTCTPSRASLHTGRLPHAHGAYSVGVDLPDGNPSLPAHLSAAGYATRLIGKSHLSSWQGPDSPELQRGATARWGAHSGSYAGYDQVELSFGHGSWGASGHYRLWLYDKGCTDAEIAAMTRLRPAAGEGQVAAFDWDLPPELYDSSWATERAIAHMRELSDGDQPFFLSVNYQGPHHPFVAPRDADVDRPDVVPPAYVPGEHADKPPHYRAAREGRLREAGYVLDPGFPMPGQCHGQDFRAVDEEWARATLSRYHYAIEQIDACVGQLLDELDALGIADDTIVVFTSDHGELGGAHGLWMKGPFSYEESTAIPLLVRWPNGGIRGGRVDDGLVSLTDLAPTLLRAAGVEVPLRMDDGHDLLPQWRGERRVRESVVLEYLDDPRLLASATIVTDSWKLTAYLGGVYAGREDEVGELYDAGGGELVNLWDDEGSRKAKAEHLDALHRAVPPLSMWRVPPRVGGV
nr:sulfatase-like hydrolase/transferase [Motilibacter aurantiacus]